MVSKIIALLAAIVPSFVDWWKKRQAGQQQAELRKAEQDAQARVAAVRAEPGNEWLRFTPGTGTRPLDSISDQAGAAQSDPDK